MEPVPVNFNSNNNQCRNSTELLENKLRILVDYIGKCYLNSTVKTEKNVKILFNGLYKSLLEGSINNKIKEIAEESEVFAATDSPFNKALQLIHESSFSEDSLFFLLLEQCCHQSDPQFLSFAVKKWSQLHKGIIFENGKKLFQIILKYNLYEAAFICEQLIREARPSLSLGECFEYFTTLCQQTKKQFGEEPEEELLSRLTTIAESFIEREESFVIPVPELFSESFEWLHRCINKNEERVQCSHLLLRRFAIKQLIPLTVLKVLLSDFDNVSKEGKLEKMTLAMFILRQSQIEDTEFIGKLRHCINQISEVSIKQEIEKCLSSQPATQAVASKTASSQVNGLKTVITSPPENSRRTPSVNKDLFRKTLNSLVAANNLKKEVWREVVDKNVDRLGYTLKESLWKALELMVKKNKSGKVSKELAEFWNEIFNSNFAKSNSGKILNFFKNRRSYFTNVFSKQPNFKKAFYSLVFFHSLNNVKLNAHYADSKDIFIQEIQFVKELLNNLGTHEIAEIMIKIFRSFIEYAIRMNWGEEIIGLVKALNNKRPALFVPFDFAEILSLSENPQVIDEALELLWLENDNDDPTKIKKILSKVQLQKLANLLNILIAKASKLGLEYVEDLLKDNQFEHECFAETRMRLFDRKLEYIDKKTNSEKRTGARTVHIMKTLATFPWFYHLKKDLAFKLVQQALNIYFIDNCATFHDEIEDIASFFIKSPIEESIYFENLIAELLKAAGKDEKNKHLFEEVLFRVLKNCVVLSCSSEPITCKMLMNYFTLFKNLKVGDSEYCIKVLKNPIFDKPFAGHWDDFQNLIARVSLEVPFQAGEQPGREEIEQAWDFFYNDQLPRIIVNARVQEQTVIKAFDFLFKILKDFPDFFTNNFNALGGTLIIIERLGRSSFSTELYLDVFQRSLKSFEENPQCFFFFLKTIKMVIEQLVESIQELNQDALLSLLDRFLFLLNSRLTYDNDCSKNILSLIKQVQKLFAKNETKLWLHFLALKPYDHFASIYKKCVNNVGEQNFKNQLIDYIERLIAWKSAHPQALIKAFMLLQAAYQECFKNDQGNYFRLYKKIIKSIKHFSLQDVENRQVINWLFDEMSTLKSGDSANLPVIHKLIFIFIKIFLKNNENPVSENVRMVSCVTMLLFGFDEGYFNGNEQLYYLCIGKIMSILAKEKHFDAVSNLILCGLFFKPLIEKEFDAKSKSYCAEAFLKWLKYLSECTIISRFDTLDAFSKEEFLTKIFEGSPEQLSQAKEYISKIEKLINLVEGMCK